MEIAAADQSIIVRTEGQVDKISNLPDTILHHILSFLPTVESVRTSLLARRWEHLWTWTGVLHYDDSQMTRTRNAFFSFVMRTDRLHRAASIERYDFTAQKSIHASFFQSWIFFVLERKNVKELNVDMISSEHFEIPRCKALRHLKLRLGYGRLELSTTDYFSSLETLSLSKVSFGGTSFNEISRLCPQLRKLRLDNCFGIHCLNISHPLLVEFEIEGCELDHLIVDAKMLRSLFVQNWDAYGYPSVRIVAPDLQTFKWLDNLAYKFYIGSFTSLKAAHVRLDVSYLLKNEESYLKHAKNFLSGLASATSLQLEMTWFWVPSFSMQ